MRKRASQCAGRLAGAAALGMLAAAACTRAPTPTVAPTVTPTSATAQATAQAEAPVQEPFLAVTVLGSGTPAPSRTQAGTAILVETEGDALLIDCGRGCTTRLAQYDPRLVARIDKLFFTHLHSDHTVGAPDLWLNGWTQGRTVPLRVWGPRGSRELMRGLLAAYSIDIRSRLDDGVPPNTDGLRTSVTLIELREAVVFDEKDLRVTAFPVKHGATEAYGYRVDHAGRSVLISGDTTLTPSLSRVGAGADVALLEVLSPAMVGYLRNSFPPAQVDAVLGLHLTADQAGQVFAAISPKLGVYYHTVASCGTDSALLADTGSAFPGKVQVARDLFQVKLTAGELEARYLGPDTGECPAH